MLTAVLQERGAVGLFVSSCFISSSVVAAQSADLHHSHISGSSPCGSCIHKPFSAEMFSLIRRAVFYDDSLNVSCYSPGFEMHY